MSFNVKASLQGYSVIIPEFTQSEPIKRAYNANYTKSIKSIFEVLGDENNYPIMFHCNAGADRTGTVAFLINGVLGVSYEDLTRDFELTSFSKGGRRWRSNIEDGMFTEDGNAIIFTVVNNRQISEFLEMIKNHPDTFAYYTDVSGVRGNFRWFKDDIAK